MSSIFTLSIVQSALELGFIYSLVALALFISFTILNIADLSTDGCFTFGCAVGAMVTLAGHPVLALFAAMGAGVCSGFITAFLQTRMGIESILAGIIVNTGLYTINIAVMGFASNVNLFGCDTIFSLAKETIGGSFYKIIVVAIVVAAVALILSWFLGTRLGLSIRATGDNPDMVKASSINPGFMITVRRTARAVSEILRHQSWYRNGYDRACQPDHRRIHYRERLDIKTRLRSGTRKLSVPLFGCGSASLKCSGGMLKAGFRDHRCGSDRVPVFKKARGVFQTEIDRDPKEKGGFVCCS